MEDHGDLQPIHTRTYDVQAWKRSETAIVLRGTVRDVKPPDLYIEGDDEPLTIHHMIVDLEVSFPDLQITAAEVVFESHPHELCPSITEHYGKLVGLSIARGFTHKVRELFAGPRGCSHTTALLQAMAPVAVQCTWSMRVAAARERSARGEPPVAMTPELRRRAAMINLNTCHVWDEEGDHAQAVLDGEYRGMPINVRSRLEELGRDPEAWLAARG